MKSIFYSILVLLFVFPSCIKRVPKNVVAETEQSEVATKSEALVNDNSQTITSEKQQEKGIQEVKSFEDLKKYSVVVATLTNPLGVENLEKAFADSGVEYAVVTNPVGRYHFVLCTSDSRVEASKVRTNFLLKYIVNKSKNEIWNQFRVHLTDAFVLEKKS